MEKESVDEFKRRHLRQNKEIVRVNSMQSFRIRELEQENRRLCNEVLELREKNAYLEFHESGMNHAQEYMDSVDNTKRALEVKVREIREMLRGLGRQNEDTSRALTLERRSRRSSVLPQSNFPQPNIAAQDGDITLTLPSSSILPRYPASRYQVRKHSFYPQMLL